MIIAHMNPIGEHDRSFASFVHKNRTSSNGKRKKFPCQKPSHIF